MSHLSGGRARWVALGVVVGALAAGGVAYAAIPDSGGVFHACYKNVGGQLRLVNSASDCGSSETATQWNQTGPTGATGPSGPSGPQGPGATWSTATLLRDNTPQGTPHTLATTNGINLQGQCGLAGVVTALTAFNAGDLLDVSGTENSGTSTSSRGRIGRAVRGRL